jgi:hypothetical protein
MECAGPPRRAITGTRSIQRRPDKRHLAICSEVRTLMGLRVHQAGLLYSIEEKLIVGRIVIGKRTPKGWIGTD